MTHSSGTSVPFGMRSTCPECGGQMKPEDEEKRGYCFRCHVKGLSFTYVGGGRIGDRQAFHDHTNKEREREILSNAKKRGFDIQPKTRWV